MAKVLCDWISCNKSYLDFLLKLSERIDPYLRLLSLSRTSLPSVSLLELHPICVKIVDEVRNYYLVRTVHIDIVGVTGSIPVSSTTK